MKQILRAAFLCAVLLSFGFNAQAQGPAGGARAVPVSVVTVVQSDFADAIEALGTARANETVMITAKLTETVREVLFEDGQDVKKDDVLIILDNAEESANLKSAQAMAAEKRSAYKRAAGLEQQQIVSRASYEERQAQLRQAEADVQSIKSRISDAFIKAPFDGKLGLRSVSVGTLVRPGEPITTIDDLSQMKIDFDVPAIYLQKLKPGLAVAATVEGFGDRLFKGAVSIIDTQVDPVTRSAKVRAIVPNTDMTLRPGLLVNVTLDLNPRTALVVPEGALTQQRDRTYVFVLDEKDGAMVARKVEITRGARRLGEVEVLSGLEEGQKIILTGLMGLTDGSTVQITE